MKRKLDADSAFDVVNTMLLILLSVVFLYPLFWLVMASISSPEAVWNGKVWLFPVDISFDGYLYVLNNQDIWRSTMNTVIYTVAGTSINLFLTVTAAYPLSRKEFMGSGFITLVYAVTLFFGGGMIPTYLLIKNLNMLNSIWALILPGAVSVWFIIVTRTFFQINIPDEMLDSAKIDGCSNVKCLIRIVLPLSIPILAVLSLFFSVGHWNSYFGAFLYMSDREQYPLQLILREIIVQSQVSFDSISLFDAKTAHDRIVLSEKIKYSIIVFSSLPLLVAYPFVQKHFKKGVLIGSIKG